MKSLASRFVRDFCPRPDASSPLADECQVLRGEVFGLDHLEQHARQLGQRLVVAPKNAGTRNFRRRFEDNARILREVYKHTCEAIRSGEPMTPAAEWLLDNFHVVEEQLREIVDDLPERFYRELPKVESGEPRVYVLAVELLIHTDSALDEETVARCVRAFQEHSPLSIGETWAFPIMLRLGLVENLRRLASQMLESRRCRELAARLVNEWTTDADFPLDVSSMDRCAPTVLHLIEELQQRQPLAAAGLKALERQLARHQTTTEETVRVEHQRQAGNQVSIGNVITSMRLISSLDWVQFFERTNLVEEILRRDPAGIYPQMDFATRDRYRHAVEEIAKASRFSDRQIADHALSLASLARTTPGEPPLDWHVGYFLVDEGRKELELRTDYRPSLRNQLVRFMTDHPHVTFLGSVGVGTGVLLAVLMAMVVSATGGWGIAALAAILALLPASELAVSVTNLLVTTFLPPRLVPKLEFKEKVPDQWATCVVIPSMLASVKEIDSLTERLELHYLANPEPALRFALLTDFRDAPQQQMPEDQPLVEHATAAIRRLNEQYGSGGRGPFYFFHRERLWNPVENVWMGWERKRGKLAEFNHLLRGNDGTSYRVIEGDRDAFIRERREIRFVITLDSDTQLPYGAARRMIGALAHPLNRPRFSADGRRLVGGYSLLQPRLTVHLASANRSRFSWLYANSPGIDPYATCASDVYQDLYGEGSFTGKGIYDVDAFEQAVDGAFPDNRILSHDLIEGCHARVALVSDLELFDGYPARYDAESQRTHRWVRGDWQLLPWLFPKVPATPLHGGSRWNRLSLLSHWKIFDNLRRSLIAPALLAFLVVGWVAFPSLATLWNAVGLGVILFPLGAQIALACRGSSWSQFRLNLSSGLANDWPRTLLQCVLGMVFLPHKAWVMTDAIVRTLARMFVTRKRLLEWETAAATEHRLSQGNHFRLSSIWFAPALAIALCFVMTPTALLIASPWLLGWLAAPAVVHWLNQPFLDRETPLSEAQTRRLRQMARRTWAFFENFVGPEDH